MCCQATTASAEGSLSFDAGRDSNPSSTAFDPLEPIKMEQEGDANMAWWTERHHTSGLKRQRAFFEAGKELMIQQVSLPKHPKHTHHKGENRYERAGSRYINPWLDELAMQRSDAGKKASQNLIDCLRQCDKHLANKMKSSLPSNKLNTAALHPISKEGSAFSRRKPHDPMLEHWTATSMQYYRSTKLNLSQITDSDGIFSKRIDLVNLVKYTCEYCGTEKESTSTGQDGRSPPASPPAQLLHLLIHYYSVRRVRIRCECGGKYGDGGARMHAR